MTNQTYKVFCKRGKIVQFGQNNQGQLSQDEYFITHEENSTISTVNRDFFKKCNLGKSH